MNQYISKTKQQLQTQRIHHLYVMIAAKLLKKHWKEQISHIGLALP